MKNKLLVLSVVLLFAGAHLTARQSGTAKDPNPCNDSTATDSKTEKKEVVEHDPFADPVEELRIRAQKKIDEKNFKELQDAATELSAIAARMSREINAGGQFVVSLRVLDDLNQIEKLTKRVRSRAK